MPDLHLSRAELVDWRDRGAGDRARIVTHLAGCAACREMAADVERQRPAADVRSRFDVREFKAAGYRAGARPRLVKGWMLPAAAALVILALVPVWQSQFGGDSGAMRGGRTAIVLVRPVDGSIAAGELVFEWQGAAAGDRVRLNVVDLDRADTPLIERDVTGTRYEPTPEERSRFRSGQSVHWYVDAGGVTSAAATFRVR